MSHFHAHSELQRTVHSVLGRRHFVDASGLQCDHVAQFGVFGCGGRSISPSSETFTRTWHIFLSFLVAILGRGDRNATVDVLAKYENHLKPPISLVSLFRKEEYKDDPRGKADAVLFQCQKFTWSLSFSSPYLPLPWRCLMFLYHGSWDYKSPQFYIAAISNLSVFLGEHFLNSWNSEGQVFCVYREIIRKPLFG